MSELRVEAMLKNLDRIHAVDSRVVDIRKNICYCSARWKYEVRVKARETDL